MTASEEAVGDQRERHTIARPELDRNASPNCLRRIRVQAASIHCEPSPPGGEIIQSTCGTRRRLEGLIEENPVIAQVGHGLGETVEVHRLDDVTVDPEVIAVHDVALFL